MSKNVIINETTYNNVSFVKLLQTNGSLASFVDADTIGDGKTINYAEGSITPSEDKTYLDFTDFAFTPRIFGIFLDSLTPDAAITCGVFVYNDVALYARSTTAGKCNVAPTLVGTVNEISPTPEAWFECSTIQQFTTTARAKVQRTPTAIRICEATGTPDFVFASGRKYNWFAVGWED